MLEKEWMIINRSVLSRVAFAAIFFCFSSWIFVPRAGAFTMEEYQQAVLNNKALPSQSNPASPVPSGQKAATSQAPLQTPAAQPVPTYAESRPTTSIDDYYHAIINRQRTPIYYSNQPALPAPQPSAPSNQGGSKGPAAPPAAPPPAPEELSAQEARLFALINSARTNEGVRPVVIDMKLVEIAHIKAQDMIDNNYFGHFSPTYGSPGQMLRKFGVSFRSAGENLAKAGDVSKAHLLFLTSTQGHREIMLNPNYNKVGVAVVPRGSYVLVVELFAEL